MKMQILAAVAALAASGIPSRADAQGYQVQPMLAHIAPSGSASNLRMSITNTGSVPITLEMEPFRAAVDEAGNPTRAQEDQDLLVFPPQIIVQPGSEQAVQVRYVGDPSLSAARMYGVRVSQLPVRFGSGTATGGATADVQVGFNFLTHIVVAPEGARSTLTISNIAEMPGGALGLTVRNQGNAVIVLNDYVWDVRDAAARSATITTDKINLGEFSALMPDQDRRVVIPASEIASMSPPLQVTLRAR